MFLCILLITSVVLDAAKSLSTGKGLSDQTDFSDPINSESLWASDSLFSPDVDDSAAGDLAMYYPSVEDLNVDDTSVTFPSSEDVSSISDSSTLGSGEDIFALSNHADLFDEGDVVMAKALPTSCEGNLMDSTNLIERSENLDQPAEEELADSSGGICLPSKTKTPELNLPNDLDNLYDQLNPKPAPLLDQFLLFTPYRVFCPLNGDYSLVCCAEGNGAKRVKCVRCKFLRVY